jgi:hypothetical protein
MTAIDIARDVLRRGWKPVPVPKGVKSPRLKGWHTVEINEANLQRYFDRADLNVGAQMGPVSGGLADVDLDCGEAVLLAPSLLPPTQSVYGRRGKSRSHYLYRVADPEDGAVRKYAAEDNKNVVELRIGGGGKGAQSIMPGSVHTSGETYCWDVDGEPAAVPCAVLKAAVIKIAVGTILLRHWPPVGVRHESMLAVGGYLARAGWTAEAVEDFVRAVVEVQGESTKVEEHARTAGDSVRAHAAGQQVYGAPKLAELFGDAAVKKIGQHVGYRGSTAATGASGAGFELNSRNQPSSTSQHNIRLALEKLGVEVRYDSFNNKNVVDEAGGRVELDDAVLDALWLRVDEAYKFLPTREFFARVVMNLARRRPFHPVRDYLDGLTWDGVPRLDGWLVTYGGAEATEFACEAGSISMIAAVRRVRHPGVKFDEMLILESDQGLDKSTGLAILAVEQEWFSDDLPLDADSKRIIEQSAGKWIVEVAELSGMTKSKVEHLKAMLSRQYDRSRLAYDRMTTERPRQFVLIGTTNHAIYLRDITGNRRFWPVKIVKFDAGLLRRDRDQLWAEAAARESAGESIRLDKKLWDAAGVEQERRAVPDPWYELLDAALGDITGKLMSHDAWRIVRLPGGQRHQEHNTRMGQAMIALGFVRRQVRTGGREREYAYCRGTLEEQQDRIYVTVSDAGAIVGHSQAVVDRRQAELAADEDQNRPF